MPPTPETTAPAPLVVLLSRVMETVGNVSKSERANMGAGGSYNFRGIDTVVNAVSPALRAHGVVVMPELLHVEYGTAPTRNGVTNTVHVQVRYTFHGPAGDSLSTSVAAESFDNGDKATAKAMSVALRTAMLQALMLPTDEEDPDRETYERAPDRPREQPTRPALPPTEGQQRRERQASAAAPPAGPPLPPRAADQYRDRVLAAPTEHAPGEARDRVLQAITAELRAQPGALSTPVEVPEAWRDGRPATAPLSALITIARTASDLNDPWKDPNR